MARSAAQIHRLVTTSCGTHDFLDSAGVGAWWAQNAAAAGATTHYRLTIVAELVGVYPAPSCPPAAPTGKAPELKQLAGPTVTRHPWGGQTWPVPGA